MCCCVAVAASAVGARVVALVSAAVAARAAAAVAAGGFCVFLSGCFSFLRCGQTGRWRASNRSSSSCVVVLQTSHLR